MSAPLLAATSLCKWYGRNLILNRISLTVQPGEVLVMLGHNGAGKTTLIRILAGLLKPDRGEVRVNGRRPTAERNAAIGCVLHEPMLYSGLTTRENLALFAKLNRIRGVEAAVTECLASVQGINLLDQRIATLSNGNRKRVSIARALLTKPQLLLLDEAETGLDSEARRLLLNVIRDRKSAGLATVLATHSSELHAELADRNITISNGRKAREEAVQGHANG